MYNFVFLDYPSPSLKRLPPASWTVKGTLSYPEKNLNDGVTWIVELGNPMIDGKLMNLGAQQWSFGVERRPKIW